MNEKFEAYVTGNFLVKETVAENWLSCWFSSSNKNPLTIQRVKHKKLDGVWYVLKFDKTFVTFKIFFDSWLKNKVHPYCYETIGGVYVNYTNMNDSEFNTKLVCGTLLEDPIIPGHFGYQNLLVFESVLRDLWPKRNEHESYDSFVCEAVELSDKRMKELISIPEELYGPVEEPIPIHSSHFAKEFFENRRNKHFETHPSNNQGGVKNDK